jgi:hypothetical protein
VANDLPEVQQQVAFQPASGGSTEGFQRLSQALGQFQQAVTGKFVQLAVGEAAERGTLAGQQLDFKKGPGFTEAQQAFNKAGEEAEKQQAMLQISQGISQLKQDVLNPETFNAATALPDFESNAKQMFSSVLQNVSEKNKPLIRNVFDFHSFNAQHDISNRVQQVGLSAMEAHKNILVRSLNSDAVKAAAEGELPQSAALVGQASQSLQASADIGLNSPEYSALEANHIDEEAHKAGYMV